jgi:cysteine synthase A
LERDLIDEMVTVSDEEAIESCRQIATKEGLLVGISSGANSHAAL